MNFSELAGRADTGLQRKTRKLHCVSAVTNRRGFLAWTGAVATGCALNSSWIGRAEAARSLKIATYGGNFEDSFKKYVYPEFEKATGISVESVSEPGGLEFLLQIAQSNRAGVAPIDLCMASQEAVLRGSTEAIWRPFDMAKLPNAANLDQRYIHHGKAGVDAVGALGWFMAMIVNPDEVKPAPDSWTVLWDQSRKNAWGLSTGGDSPLFEIAATLYFGGYDVLQTEDGVRRVVAKLAELKPTTKVWWSDEGTMQTAYENDEVVGGMYFYDVAHVMKRNGTSVTPIMPKEGGVIDIGSWCQPSASTKTEEAEEFINFMSQPAMHALLSRKIGTAPLIARDRLDLTDAEFDAVSSNIPPLQIAVAERMQHQDFMDAQFTKMLTS
jgi:putative spermidine/putrescine transport system substrate-binding protein